MDSSVPYSPINASSVCGAWLGSLRVELVLVADLDMEQTCTWEKVSTWEGNHIQKVLWLCCCSYKKTQWREKNEGHRGVLVVITIVILVAHVCVSTTLPHDFAYVAVHDLW